MSKQLHIVYLPGLGDRYDPVRRACLRAWRWYGMRVTMVPMQWRSDESYEVKRARVDEVLGELDGERVVLMGESAGGSMALSMYAARVDKLAGVMTLCGKNTRSDNVSSTLYARNPAFRESMLAVEAVARDLTKAARARFVSIVPWHDGTVPVVQTLLPGCQKLTLPAVGHLFSILLMLTIYGPLVARCAKRLANR